MFRRLSVLRLSARSRFERPLSLLETPCRDANGPRRSAPRTPTVLATARSSSVRTKLYPFEKPWLLPDRTFRSAFGRTDELFRSLAAAWLDDFASTELLSENFPSEEGRSTSVDEKNGENERLSGHLAPRWEIYGGFRYIGGFALQRSLERVFFASNEPISETHDTLLELD